VHPGYHQINPSVFDILRYKADRLSCNAGKDDLKHLT
jgi:hypothetical protein